MIRYLILAAAPAPCFVIRYNELWHWTAADGWDLMDRNAGNASFNPKGIRKSCLMECTLIGGVDAVV